MAAILDGGGQANSRNPALGHEGQAANSPDDPAIEAGAMHGLSLGAG
jgi:hypothetical protein